jgi:hypothetical protein
MIESTIGYILVSLTISFIDILRKLSMGYSHMAVRHQIGSRLTPLKENPPTHSLSQDFEITNTTLRSGCLTVGSR